MRAFEDIVLCPDCRGGPVRDLACTACGRRFDDDSGTPRLFPRSAGLTYEVPYVPLEEVKRVLDEALTLPEGAGAHGGVYHLDGAHVAAIQSLPAGATVLEVGCGGGQMRRYVEGLGLRYVGTDISKTRVHAHLREFGGPDFLSDAHHLPVRDQSVDLIYSAAVTEHLAAPHRALQEFHRVLRPGGLFLGNCSFMEPWHDESFFHVSPNGAAALLLQAGFRPRAIWPSYRYSGYLALLRMGNRATRLLGPAGLLVQRYSAAFYGLKRLLRGSRAYPPRAHLADLAITAGATDWIAQKPAA